MESNPISTGERENPRTRRVRQLILDTAVEILLDDGATSVTASIVAEKADVARTTIYRHWPDQRSLLLATIETLTTPHHTPTPSGPLDHDIRLALSQLRKRLVHRETRSVFGALAGFAAQDPAFGDAQRAFVNRLTVPMVVALEAAVDRGDLAAETDCNFEANMLAGTLLYQHLTLRGEITQYLIDETADRWLATKSLP